MTDNYTEAALYGMKNFNSKVREKVKKEMGMMKLIELLNEYEETVNNHYHYYWGIDGDYISSNVSGTDHTLDKNEASIIIKSKEYGFIKWLVDNDKIDLEKLDKPEYIDLGDDFMKPSDSDYLIMILAISDTPIDDLISYLK